MSEISGSENLIKTNLTKKKLTEINSSNLAKPDFTLLMANYNRAEYLPAAIESVLRQTHQNWELLIMDDASFDSSVEVIKKYLGDKRLKFFQQPSNKGYTIALKELISSAQGEVIGIIDSDDVLAETALARMLEAYRSQPKIGFAYSQFMVCDKNLKPLKLGFASETLKGESNLHRHHINHFKTFKREAYFQTSGYDEEILYAEDIDLVFKMEEKFPSAFVNEVLYYYRFLADSQTHLWHKKQISGMSAKVAKFNAFSRRFKSNSLVPNVGPQKMIWEMSKGFYLATTLLDFKKMWFFLKKIIYFIKIFLF
ncbi:MAG: glycosyltransferase [Planctomycetes bacterium]|jgi:glycosyltransferase involved in cell wall biosynthesis|nr:glycosyltransferase [Planctomycetota bacterium]